MKFPGGALWRSLAAAGCGALGVAGFAPLGWHLLTLLALAGLALLWDRDATPGRAAWTGLCFGLGWFGAGVSWVYVSLHEFGEMPAHLAAGATAGFCLFLALYPALAGWVLGRLRAAPGLRAAAAFAACWAGSEWLRGTLFTGFPWLAAGYTQIPDGPLAGYAPVLGTYGVSLLLAASAGLLAQALAGAGRARVRALLVLAAVWGGGLLLGQVAWTQPQGAAFEVAIVQGNIRQDLKWRPQWLQATLLAYHRLTLSAHGRLILLPETALPMLDVQVPRPLLQALGAHARGQGGDLLLGLPEFRDGDPPRYFNSVFSLGSAPVQAYRKHHLVPFGDYFPFKPYLGPLLEVLHIPMSDFSHGAAGQAALAVAGQQVGVDICYEDAFGEEIAAQLPAATVLANFTNDAWWGDSLAPEQHLQLAQARALETGRFLLRATNTGVSAVIDARGRVAARAPKFAEAVLQASAQGYTGSTPYVRNGNTVFGLLVTGLLGFSLRRHRRPDAKGMAP